VLYPVAGVLGPNPAAQAAGFLRSCEAGCAGPGRDARTCRAACACVLDRATAEGLREALVTDGLAPEGLARVQEMGRACFRERR
jgi:hypothetical protein